MAVLLPELTTLWKNLYSQPAISKQIVTSRKRAYSLGIIENRTSVAGKRYFDFLADKKWANIKHEVSELDGIRSDNNHGILEG